MLRSLARALLFVLAATPAVAQDIALRADLLIDGQGNPLRDAAVLVRGDRVMDVVPVARIPAGVRVVNLRGYTLMPGMIDSHVHITANFDENPRDARVALHAAHNARSLLESGFTTVRTLGDPGFVDVDLRDAIEAGLITGPRLLVAGTGLTDRIAPGAEGDRVAQGAAPADEAAIRRFVKSQTDGDVDWVKIFATRSSRSGGTPVYSQEQLEWAVDQAARAGRPVSAHAHSAEGARRAIHAGARTIEHGALLDEEALALMAQEGAYFAPNLYLSEYYLSHAPQFGFSEEALDWTRKLLPVRTEVFRKAAKAGINIIFSSDANSGWISSGTTAVEFQRRVAAGQSHRDALISATSRAAAALGLSDEIGDLRPGMAADIIAVEGNPLEDITALEHVVFVMKGGQIVKQAGPAEPQH